MQKNLYKKHLIALLMSTLLIYFLTKNINNVLILVAGYSIVILLSLLRNRAELPKKLIYIFLESTFTFALIFSLSISSQIQIDRHFGTLALIYIAFGFLMTSFVYLKSKKS